MAWNPTTSGPPCLLTPSPLPNHSADSTTLAGLQFNPYASPTTTPSLSRNNLNAPPFIPSYQQYFSPNPGTHYSSHPYITPPLQNTSFYPNPASSMFLSPSFSPLSNRAAYNSRIATLRPVSEVSPLPNQIPFLGNLGGLSPRSPPQRSFHDQCQNSSLPQSSDFSLLLNNNHTFSSTTHVTGDIPMKGEPDACLFVASLNAQKTDDQLTDSVSRHFSKWGPLMNVKVMKDWMNRPYAFVQYRSVSHAIHALEESHDTVVDGRHVRVEPARVNRTLFLMKLPKNMTHQILHQYLSKWGRVEDVTMLVNQSTGKPKGCAFAKFRYREDAIRAYLHIRQQGRWGIEWASNLDKNTPETDRHSVFVGQLNPNSVTESSLRLRFGQYGSIEHVHLMIAEGEAFAFIRWDDEESALLAIKKEHGREFQGYRIICQYRETPEHKTPVVRRPLGRSPKPLTRPQNNKQAFPTPFSPLLNDGGSHQGIQNHPSSHIPTPSNVYTSQQGYNVNPATYAQPLPHLYAGYPLTQSQNTYYGNPTQLRYSRQNPPFSPISDSYGYLPERSARTLETPQTLASSTNLTNESNHDMYLANEFLDPSQVFSNEKSKVEWNDFEQYFANTLGPTQQRIGRPRAYHSTSLQSSAQASPECSDQGTESTVAHI